MTTGFNIQTSAGKSFIALQGQTLLESAEKSGIFMPYSCRTGRCSSCKVKVVLGKSTAKGTELGLNEVEKAAGWVLSCVRVPDSGMKIDVEDIGDVIIPAARTLPCRIKTIERLCEDVVRIILRTPPTTPLTWLAGQYIDVIGPEGVRRSYSLANSSLVNNELELHIRQVSGGVLSQFWFGKAKPNDLLRLHGPLGTSFMRDVTGKDVIFMATGTGLAPIKAMLEDLDVSGRLTLARSVYVFWGARKAEDLYCSLSIPESITYIPVLSRPNEYWAGEVGYVQTACLKYLSDFTQAQVYACGSENMIASAKATLCAAGLAEINFRADAFVSSSN